MNEDWLAFFEDGSFLNIGKQEDVDAAEQWICDNLRDDALYFGTRSFWLSQMEVAKCVNA